MSSDYPNYAGPAGPGSLSDYSVVAEAPPSVPGEDRPGRSGFAGTIDWIGQFARNVTPALERVIDIERISRGQRPIYSVYDKYYGRGGLGPGGRYGGQRLGEVIDGIRSRNQERWNIQDKSRGTQPAPTPSAGEEGTDSLLKSGDTLVNNLQAQIDALQEELNALRAADAEVGVSDVELGPGARIPVQPWGGDTLVDPTRALSP